MMHGAYTAQRALEAGVLDELQAHQIPVLFGGGRRLFQMLPSRVELEIVRVIDTPEATHIRYRVRRLVGRSSQQAEWQSLTGR
jgi:dihydrofolate reductase